MKTLLVILLIFSAQNLFAERPADYSQTFIKSCNENQDCNLLLFNEIGKLYRPSKEEIAVERYIQALKVTAENFIWKTPLWAQRDQMGNIVIRLPATGKFKNLPNQKYFGLLSHMDMVLAYAKAKPGEDVRKYFVNGVDMEVVNGWIQSKNKQTTLGADNGIGVAFALRYLLDKNIPHPPLELLFTVQEEIGLFGAAGLEIPLLSRRMLCLDGMTPEPTMIITGSQGGATGLITGVFKGEQAGTDRMQLAVTVTNLAGGHSGADIFRKRLNGVKGFAELFNYLKTIMPSARIQSVADGDLTVYNKIPNLFTGILSVSKTELKADFKSLIENKMKEIVSRFPDDNKDYSIDVQAAEYAAQTPIASQLETEAFIKGISDAPNGIVETGGDPYPHGDITSSNLSFWGFGKADSGDLISRLGFNTRSFFASSLSATANAVAKAIASPLSSLGELKVEKIASFPPWLVPSSSPLLKQLLSLKGSPFSKTYLVPVGLDPSALMQKYLDMDIVAIGPVIYFAHTVNEQLELASVSRTAKSIETIIQSQ